MDRKLLMEMMGKQVVPTSKIQVANDIDDAYVSIRASPHWDEINRISLQDVSLN
jgi:hypothetical protein